MPDTKQGEKEYLTRTGSTEWERVKPFSYDGADTLMESARLLHEFSVAMLALQPGPDDLILDLGAGGCWCSDLLTRLNRRAVAVDISIDMLRVGRSRANGTGIQAVAGDLERLPFRSGAFDKAVCLNAIHHVPDIPAALREVARVLREDGVLAVLEPGKGHAQQPGSTAAMRDYGVLEQDILIPDFVSRCREAGFADVRLKPLLSAVPAFDVTPDEWARWSALAATKRPARALAKLGRAALELVGVAKNSVMFPEALGMSLIRTLQAAMEDHPILIAAKTTRRLESESPAWAARIEVLEAAPRVRAGGTWRGRIRISNLGEATWQPTSVTGTGHVTLGIQLLDRDGRLVARNHHPIALPRPVPPGDSVTLPCTCAAPPERGSARMKLDLVVEGVTWFEPTGSVAPTVPVTVD
jgi:ubiquinone/menaquinone biosynthesis C-methylase UbiE